MRRLDKSSYLIGRQCALRLWLRAHGVGEPEVEAEDLWELRVEEGTEVEGLAAPLFAAGSRFQVELGDDRLRAVVDVLEPRGARWWLWEIKASTEVSALHRFDLAFQALVARRAGWELAGCGVVHLAKDSVRGDGPLDPRALLRMQDLTAEVERLLPTVEREVQAQLRGMSASEAPRVRPSRRCASGRKAKGGDRPSDCGHLHPWGRCGSALPEHWAWRLPKLAGANADFVAAMPVQDLRLLDPDAESPTWTALQRRVIRAARDATPFADPLALGGWLAALRWPVAYMDFEFDPTAAVPAHPGCKPYEQLPFQWSLHVQEAPGGALRQEAFLFDGGGDPSPAFLSTLRAALPESGSIVVHHAQAEAGVLKRLADRFGGALGAWARALPDRFADTEELLREGYYHPDQQGSWSLKRAARPLAGRGHEDLELRDGMAAVLAWRELRELPPGAEREGRRAHLLAYCGRDSLLMHEIVEAARVLAGSGNESAGRPYPPSWHAWRS